MNDLDETRPNPVGDQEDLGETRPNTVKTESDLMDTQKNPSAPASQPPAKRKFPGWLALVVLVLLLVIGVLSGYGSGISRRIAAQNTLVMGQLDDQFQLGQQAVEAGQLELAKQHFEFVLQHKPDYPGAQAAYADLLVKMLITPTLTPTLTPTPVPTTDTRSIDEIYNSVVGDLSTPGPDLCARDWDGIIAKLDSLRKADITYKAAEVDGMYFISLRNRGLCKIYPQTYEPNASCADLKINLEGGIFDLSLAENFGPLDSTADSMRTWARMYVAGASFWDQDWPQVLDYFAQIMANVPNLSDSQCTTSVERWRQANIGYAEYLMSKGDYCGAENQFDAAFTIDSPQNEQYVPVATQASDECNGGGEATSKPKKTKTPTPGAQPPETAAP